MLKTRVTRTNSVRFAVPRRQIQHRLVDVRDRPADRRQRSAGERFHVRARIGHAAIRGTP